MFSEILTKKIRILYENQFTGFLRISGIEEKQWYLYFLLGRIVWAQAGFHDLRRWHRYVALHNPLFFEQVSQPVSLYYEYWNYTSLAKLVRRKQFPREVFSKIVECYITEVLFNIIQTGTFHYPQTGELLMEIAPRNASNMPFVMLESLQSLQRAKQEWQKWSQVGLAKISPDCVPIIENPQSLKKCLSLSTFKTLSSLAAGDKTLRDISIACKQPIIPITKAILPHVSKKLLRLTTLPDIVDNVTHGFHLELTALEKEKEKEKAPDAGKTIEIVAQSVDSSPVVKTVQSTVASSKATAYEGLSSELLTTETSPAEAPSSEQLLCSTTPPKKDFSQKNSAGTETLNARLVALIKSKLDSSQKVELPNSTALVSTVGPKESIDSPHSAKKKQETITEIEKTKHKHLPKVVHIEDSLFDSRMMSSIVEGLGYRYINIQDPLQALPTLIETKPELIFLDLVMPMANGFEVCAQIRRISTFQQIPIIIVTSNRGTLNRLRVKLSGASEFMSKPIKEKKVKKILKKYIKRRKGL